MNATTAERLDAEEFLHLALHASQRGDHRTAIACLKDLLALDGRHAMALYLLAAEHAEIGLYARAREEFRAALDIRPEMDTARFQLGLLHLQLDEANDARETFSRLATTAADPSLRVFSEGLVALLENDMTAAAARLQEGIAQCGNLPLRTDMEKLLARVEQAMAAGGEPSRVTAATDNRSGAPSIAAVATSAQADTTARARPIFLGAYRNRDDNAP